jgi:hypothetical protein
MILTVDFGTFNIHCPNLGILEQVKILLNELGLTSSLN